LGGLIGDYNPLISDFGDGDQDGGFWTIDYKGDPQWYEPKEGRTITTNAQMKAAPKQSALSVAGSCGWAAIKDNLLGLGPSAGGVLLTSRIPNGKALLGLKQIGSPDTSLWSGIALWARTTFKVGFGTSTVKGIGSAGNAAGKTLSSGNSIRAFGPVLNRASWIIGIASAAHAIQDASSCYSITH
jgi:hypothetical protein